MRETAIELGVRGTRCSSSSGDDGVVRYPTAKSTTPRRWNCCAWGIAEAVLHSGFPADERRDISFVSRMTTHELARFPRPSNADRSTPPRAEPRGRACGGRSSGFRPDVAGARGGRSPRWTLRFQWTCEGFSDGINGVTVALDSQSTGTAPCARSSGRL